MNAENHTAYWPDEEDPLAQEHGRAKLKRAEMRLLAAMVLTMKATGDEEETAFIERHMAAQTSDIYGTKSWADAQEWVKSKTVSLAATARERMRAQAVSHPVHLTFREGEPITLEAIVRARRNLVRDRVPQIKDWRVQPYWVMSVHPEHEYALRDMLLSGFPVFNSVFKGYEAVLPDEIGQVVDFRVVARC